METRMSVEHGYAGIKEGFKITGPSGETAIGYAYGADFPMDVSSPSRGELFLVSVPESRRRAGAGKAISIRAIEMMEQHGCETVVMHATSVGGQAVVDSLIREGCISGPIRTSETGKSEYRILGRTSNPRVRGYPEEMSDDLKKWFSGSQVVDEHGKPLLVYHGSRERGLTKISKMRTCYGLFFSPDMDTAGYYAGDNCCIYKAYLKIKNLADFDDDLVFNAVADAAFGGYEGERYVSIKRQRSGDEEEAEMTGGEFRSWLQKAMQALHKDSAAIQRFLQKAVSGSNEAYSSDPPITLKDLNDADIFENVFESLNDPGDSDIADLMKEEPRLQEDFDSEYYTLDKGVDDARKAYGSQDFYMYHQNDMLKAAERLGYDGVVLTDPSSRGESISYVAFGPNQIRIIGTVEDDEVKG